MENNNNFARLVTIGVVIGVIVGWLVQDRPIRLDGFETSPYFGEQEKVIRFGSDVRIYINAPRGMNRGRPTRLVLYPLPNGNSIGQSAGKIMEEGDDWHYNIQHIAAQTRWLRERLDENLVVAYLEAEPKSWPAWRRSHENQGELITEMIDSVKSIFAGFDPTITLSGHSGGGSLVFGYINHHATIPADVKRIVFLDSNYAWEDTSGGRFVEWLERSDENRLCVLAYNDSIALYNGKPFVSATGGTWYRSKMMARYIGEEIDLARSEDEDFIRFNSLRNSVEIYLKKNPNQEIFHTIQVERNGFIHSLLSGTKLEELEYKYFSDRVYDHYIAGEIPAVQPPRN